MGDWKCKKCGGKIRISLTRFMSSDYNIDKKGNPIGKCLSKLEGETIADNLYCSKCGAWYESEEFELEDIAEWMEK